MNVKVHLTTPVGSSRRAQTVMLSRSEASLCPAPQTLRGVSPERSEWAQGDTVRHIRLMLIEADKSAVGTVNRPLRPSATRSRLVDYQQTIHTPMSNTNAVPHVQAQEQSRYGVR